MEKKDLRLERKRHRREENKMFILSAAESIFAQKGYGLATMDDIASEALFSKATLYRYYKSKSEIFFEIILNSFEEVRQKLSKIKEREKNAVKKVKEIIRFLLHFYHQKRNISRIFLMEKSLMKKVCHLIPEGESLSPERDVQLLDSIKSKTDEIYKIMSDIFDEGIKTGEFRKMDVMDACYVFDALLHGFYFKRFWSDKEYSFEKSIDLIQTFFLYGIKTREKA